MSSDYFFQKFRKVYPDGAPCLYVGDTDLPLHQVRLFVFCREECRGEFVESRKPKPPLLRDRRKASKATRCSQCGRVLWWQLKEDYENAQPR